MAKRGPMAMYMNKRKTFSTLFGRKDAASTKVLLVKRSRSSFVHKHAEVSSTGTGTVGTWYRVLGTFFIKYRGTPSNFNVIESFFCKHCDMSLFFVSIAASK